MLLLQGDVESIAAKNPKELTALLEQISGSDDLKKDYEELEEQKARAEEEFALVYQKKKTVATEKKQKKQQKEEAEKHMRLQDQLVCAFKCFHLLIILARKLEGLHILWITMFLLKNLPWEISNW